jgi:hypothetical protein
MNLKKLLTNLNPFHKKPAPAPRDTSKQVAQGQEPVIVNPEDTKDEYLIKTSDLEDVNKGRGKTGIGKLDERYDVKDYILRGIAKYVTPSDIVEQVQDIFRISITPSLVTAYKSTKKWQPIISKYRQEYLATLEDVPMSHKKVRLERVEKLYEKAKTKGNVRELLTTIEHSRKEMEGDGIHSLTLNQYNIMSDEELEAKREWLLDKIKKAKSKEIIDVPSKASEDKRS